jgi:hypothetical protein
MGSLTKTIALLVACATVATIGVPAASAHSRGAWMVAWQIDQKMDAMGYPHSVVCSGRGAYRNPANAWNPAYFRFRHFRCDYEVSWSHWRVACVHTTKNRSITGRTWALPHRCSF